MSTELPYMEFDYKKYCRLEQTYKQAVKNGKDHFDFDETVFVTDYAKYVLEYLKDKFNGESN